MDKEEFLKKAKEFHGNNFDYSNLNYINNKTALEFKCNLCFSVSKITPEKHLRTKCLCFNQRQKEKRYFEKFNNTLKKFENLSLLNFNYKNKKALLHCNLCNIDKEFTTTYFTKNCRCQNISVKNKEDFIRKSKLKYNDDFEYDKLIYINGDKKVTLFHNKCGNYFETIAKNHFNGNGGCKFCKIKNRVEKSKITVDQFIEQAKQITNGNFDYEVTKSTFKNIKSKVNITCLKCGIILIVRAIDHLRGSGCYFCDKINTLNKKDAIIKCKNLYQNKFDYTNTIWTQYNKNINIICNNCKFEFKRIAMYFLEGNTKCPKCTISHLRKSPEKFLEELKTKYGEENLDYSKTKYIDADKKVILKCKIHNYEFEKLASSLLQAKSKFACFKCNVKCSSAEDHFEKFLIKNNINYKAQYSFNKWRIDFYLENSLFIQIDGEYIHGIGRDLNEIAEFKNTRDKRIYNAKLSDIKQNSYFKENNLKLLRITDRQLKKISEDNLFKLIVENL